MKKWIFLFLAIGLVVAGWWLTRTYARFTPSWDKPTFGKVIRGDIRVPITAAGLIEPYQRIEIKSKASGEVIEIRVKEGDNAKTGDVLVVLNQDDERRSVERSEAALSRSEAQLEQAKVGLAKAKAAVITAEAHVKELEANGRMTAFDVKKIHELKDKSEQEIVTAESRNDINEAQLMAARANLESAKQTVLESQHTVEIASAAVEEAKRNLGDAKERLEETTIRSPADAIITDVNLTPGQLVQSGESSFTGGTKVLELADISKYMVIARVDEADFGRVMAVSPIDALPDIEQLRKSATEDAAGIEKRGGMVKLVVDAFPDQSFTGKIVRVEPQGKLNVGAAVIQYDVHVEITDERRYMLPLGTQAQVEFTVESVINAILAPAEAVKSFQGERGVWVKLADPSGANTEYVKKFVQCRFGITDGTNTQVIEALGGYDLKPDTDLFIKLPRDRKEEED